MGRIRMKRLILPFMTLLLTTTALGQVRLYDEVNLVGECIEIGESVVDLKEFGFSRRTSSIIVDRSYTAEFFTRKKHKGQSRSLSGTSLGFLWSEFNDRIRSVRIKRNEEEYGRISVALVTTGEVLEGPCKPVTAHSSGGKQELDLGEAADEAARGMAGNPETVDKGSDLRGNAWAINEPRGSNVPTSRQPVIDVFLVADGAEQVELSHFDEFPEGKTKVFELSKLEAYQGDLYGFSAGYRLKWDLEWMPDQHHWPSSRDGLYYIRGIYARFVAADGQKSRMVAFTAAIDQVAPHLEGDDPVRISTIEELDPAPLIIWLIFNEALRSPPKVEIVGHPDFGFNVIAPDSRESPHYGYSSGYLDGLAGGNGDYKVRVNNIKDRAGNEGQPVEVGPIRVKDGKLVETERKVIPARE